MKLDLDQMIPNDRAEVERFSNFLQNVGKMNDPARPARFRAWIAADFEARSDWLGLTEDQRARLAVRLQEDTGAPPAAESPGEIIKP